MITRFLISLKFLILTLRTQKWLLKTYSKICQLDLEEFEPIDDNIKLLAFGNTIDVINHKFRFTINECRGGVVTHWLVGAQKESWYEVYRTNIHAESLKWVRTLKYIHKQLKLRKIYERQQELNLLKSRNGVM